MHYVALVNGEERQVEVTETAAGQFELKANNQTMVVDSRLIAEGTQSLIHGLETFAIESDKTPEGKERLLVRGHAIDVEVVDLRALRLRKEQEAIAGPDGPAAITAPMPGKIIAVLVKEGQTVTVGQGLVVVEAMKMQNELKAPRAGTVKNLRAESGATVDAGAPLCIVE